MAVWRRICVAAVVLFCGCAGGLPGVDEDEVVDIDFVGEVAMAEMSEWRVERVNALGAGGPDSAFLVGPGTLTLVDGTVIEVPAGTPGGTRCGLIRRSGFEGRSCVVVGVFEPGTSRAEWFSTERNDDPVFPDTFLAGRLDDIHGTDGILTFVGGHFALPIRRDVELDGCDGEADFTSTPIRLPDAAVYSAFANHAAEIVRISCAYGD